MKRLIAVIAKLVGRTPVWEIPKTKPTTPVPKEKRIRNPLLPIVIALISLVLSLVIWNTITLSQIQQKQERLWGELYGYATLPRLPSLYGIQGDISDISHDVANLGWDLGNMQEQLDTVLIKLDNTQKDVAIIKYYLER